MEILIISHFDGGKPISNYAKYMIHTIANIGYSYLLAHPICTLRTSILLQMPEQNNFYAIATIFILF